MTGFPEWLDIGLRGLLLTAVAMVWILVFVRLIGLRSLSKMTPVDFIATVATGSLIAQAGGSESWGGFAQSLCAIAAVFLVQWMVNLGRRRSSVVNAVLSNEPLLLVEDGRISDAALKASGVSRAELSAKLRGANVSNLADVRAVVLETTGDVSVLMGDAPDPALLADVRSVRVDRQSG